MATEAQIIANRRNAQKSISTQSLSMSLGTPADCFMQNKANLLDAQMNVSSAKTMNYEQITMNNEPKNKPNQTQPVVTLPAVPVLSLPKGARSNRRIYFRPGALYVNSFCFSLFFAPDIIWQCKPGRHKSS